MTSKKKRERLRQRHQRKKLFIEDKEIIQTLERLCGRRFIRLASIVDSFPAAYTKEVGRVLSLEVRGFFGNLAQQIELLNSIAKFAHLQKFGLVDVKLSLLPTLSLNFSTLVSLKLVKNQLCSLNGLFSSIPNLEELYLDANFLVRLNGFPQNLPKLRRLSLYKNQIERLEGIPLDLPMLEILNISSNPIRTLSFLSISQLRALFHDPENYEGLSLAEKGKELVAHGDLNAIYEYYRRTPKELAEFIGQGGVLSVEEEERLIYESDFEELYLLQRYLSNEHPICKAIINRIGDYPAVLIEKIQRDVPLAEKDLCHPLIPQYFTFLEEKCRQIGTDVAHKSLELLNSVFYQSLSSNNESAFQLIL